MEPLISIITPCYNSEAFIAQTINSVLNQSYKNWELIIVDDCSNDKSAALIKEFVEKHNNIQLVQLKENGGVANARNVGMLAAKGKYIAFLDSDDIWLTNKIAKQVSYMEEKQIAMSFCAYNRINEEGEIISSVIEVPFSVNYKQLLSHNVIIFSTSLTLKSAIGDLKFKAIGHEDWIFWLDLFKKCGNGYGINESLALYRIRNNSVSSNKLKAIRYTWNILRNNEKLGLIPSIYHFTKYAFATVLKRLK